MTTTSTPSTKTLAVAEVVFTDAERVALAGYRGLTRDAYALDLRQFVFWCERHGLKLFSVRRSEIELYARHLEGTGRARATVARQLCTVAGFYRYAEEEGLVATSPAVHVRRPRLDYESHAVGLDRNEVGALLVAAGLGALAEHALISLLALKGLRVSEAIGPDIEALGLERGHRTLTVLRKGGKVVTASSAHGSGSGPRYWRTALRADLRRHRRQKFRPPRRGPGRAPGCTTGRAQQGDRASYSAPCLHHRCLGRGCASTRRPRGRVPRRPRTTMRFDRARVSLDRHATYIVATYIAGASR